MMGDDRGEGCGSSDAAPLTAVPLTTTWLSSTALVYDCFEGHSALCKFPNEEGKLQTFHFYASTLITLRNLPKVCSDAECRGGKGSCDL